jgi:hypothetical protein
MKFSMNVTLELSGEEADQLRTLAGSVDARQLLRDALGEFVDTRGGEARREDEERLTLMLYVMGRYPRMSEREQRAKAREVCKRKAMAKLLSRAEVVVQAEETSKGEPKR